MPVLLTTAYFPPISYMVALSASLRQCNFAYIEACENYQKQSWRNRCDFYAASGRQSLTVPVVHEGGTFSHPITEIRIDWSKPWSRTHERALVSAYRKAAYFDHYKDGVFGLLEERPATLWELNSSILRFLLAKLSIPGEIRPTTSYIPVSPQVSPATPPASPAPSAAAGRPDPDTAPLDLREAIHPKRPDTVLSREGMEKPYFQVFARKYGFIPNLSILDLLFNEGPESVSYLI